MVKKLFLEAACLQASVKFILQLEFRLKAVLPRNFSYTSVQCKLFKSLGNSKAEVSKDVVIRLLSKVHVG